jgi:phosphate:Na+ symporter
MDEAVDTIHWHVVTYLGRISGTELTGAQTDEVMSLLEAAHDLENMGDLIETNLCALGRRRIEEGVTVSAATEEVIRNFHAAVGRALEGALHAVTQKSEEAARTVVEMKPEINRLAGHAALHEAKRLVAQEPNRVAAFTVESDILENLKRIYYFCKRMARAAGLPGKLTG